MKQLLFILLCFLLLGSSCRKHKTDANDLPPATQDGKNTFGFLLNGQPWTPQGNNGTANLSTDVDFGFKQGVFNITAYRIIDNNSNTKQTIAIGLRDSLNFLNFPNSLALYNKSLYGMSFLNRNSCSYDYFDTTFYRSGNLTITKLDKTNRIIAGVFNATLFRSGCSDTIKITEGRFDMKY